MEYYMYPLLLACYMRQGTAADAAIQAISKCVDADIFTNMTSRLCGLDVVVDAVASICHQGVKARFALALPFFRKVWMTNLLYFKSFGRLRIFPFS